MLIDFLFDASCVLFRLFVGYAVYTPPSRCSAHFVVWLGEHGQQIAWNHGTTDQGIRDCEELWREYPHRQGNSGLDSQRVLSPLWLQHQGGRLKLGMNEQARLVKACMAHCKKKQIPYHWWTGEDRRCSQPKCPHKHHDKNWPILDLWINDDAIGKEGKCWQCFAEAHRL
jgi:hypothetical protein